MFIGWVVGWCIVGAAIGFLAGNRRVVVAFLGALVSVSVLCVFGFLLTR